MDRVLEMGLRGCGEVVRGSGSAGGGGRRAPPPSGQPRFRAGESSWGFGREREARGEEDAASVEPDMCALKLKNGSKNGERAPRTGTGYPHEGPFAG